MDWDRAEAFMADVLPVARVIPGLMAVPDWATLNGVAGWAPADSDLLERLPPEQHPTRPELTVAAAELVEGVGHPDSDAGGATGVDLLRWSRQVPTYEFSPAPGGGFAGVAGLTALPGGPRAQGKARVRLTYRQQPYTTQVTNAQLPSPYRPEFELSRYVTRTFVPSVQSTQVGGSVFYLVPNDAADAARAASLPLGGESPAKILPFGEYRLRWVMVPSAGMPEAVFRSGVWGFGSTPACLGRLNATPFDLQNLAPEGGTPFAAGRLLLLGVETSEPYRRMGATYWYRDFTFVFAVAPGPTWNYFFRRGLGFRQAVRQLPGAPRPAAALPEPYFGGGALVVDDATVFNYADFNALFRLRSLPVAFTLPGGAAFVSIL